jgi:hypothetical protein
MISFGIGLFFIDLMLAFIFVFSYGMLGVPKKYINRLAKAIYAVL